MKLVTGLDFVAIPTLDADKAHDFYVNTLGLKPDPNAKYDAWAGQTCFSIWNPTENGMEFSPQKNGSYALHVEDVAEARKELEAKGVQFYGDTIDTGVCHMAIFTDPDGNDLMLHNRYKPY